MPRRTVSLAGWLETQIDQASEPYAGRPILHRLNRAEYANAIRDLLSLDIDAASLLPPDDAAFGFDNVSDALGVSPSLQEHYLDAALKIGALAVGDPKIAPGSETWRIRQDLSQDRRVNGLPLGTVGGALVHYNFPLDGEYAFQARLYRTNLNIMRGLESPHQVELALDGRRIHLASIGGAEDLASLFEKPTDTGDAVEARLRVRVPVKAGPHIVTIAFLEDPDAVEPARLQPYIRSSVDNFDWSGSPHLQSLTISGPFHPASATDTPSRRRIFICHADNDDLRSPNPLNARAPRLSRASKQFRLGHPAHLLSVRQTRRRLRRRHRAGSRAHLGKPEISVPHRARSSRLRCRQELSDRRSRTRLATLVLFVEQHSRRRTAPTGDWRAS